MSASSLDKEANMFSGGEMADRTKMTHGLREIGKFTADAECLMDLDARLWELENRIAIFDEITNAKLVKERKN